MAVLHTAIYITLAAKNVLMYIHRASELANFVKHITKAFEFSGKKTTKNQYKMHCLHSSSDDF